MSGFCTADLMSLEVSSAHAVGCPSTMPSGCMGKQPKTVILCVFSFLEVVAVVHSLSSVWLLATPWTAACQASLFITNSWSLLKLMSIGRWCHPTISSSVVPFSCLQSFPASGSFPVSQFFASGGQSIGASASVLPVNIQDWFPLGWTGWISSSVFSNITIQKHQLFNTQLSL